MGRKRRQRPKPGVAIIGGVRYAMAILAVHSTYDDGTPKQCTVLQDDTDVKLSENDEDNRFVSCYLWDGPPGEVG